MPIERFNVNTSTRFQGLQSLAPDELREFTDEAVRRLTINQQDIITALTNQVVVDKSLLPLMVSGSSQASTTSVATTEDVNSAEIESILWL
jgi:hypothetical protein